MGIFTRVKSCATVLRDAGGMMLTRIRRGAVLALLVPGLTLAAGAATASAAPAAATGPAVTAAPAFAPVPAGHSITAAPAITPPQVGTGGGGAIDFWKVELAGGDSVRFDLTYDGKPYKFELYPPGTTDVNFADAIAVDTAGTSDSGKSVFSVRLQAPYNGTFILAACENAADCSTIDVGRGNASMDAYTFTTTWLTRIDRTQQSRETAPATTIKDARTMPLGNFEAGGGAPMDFWRVNLKRGDKVEYDVTNDGNAYEYALYPPGTSDDNFASTSAVTSASTTSYGQAMSHVTLRAPYTGKFLLAVCENAADGNCANVEIGDGTNPMNEYTYTDRQTGGLESRTALGLSVTSITYGHEKALRLHVRVTGKFGGTPAGRVSVSSGAKTICVVRLSGGKGTCAPAGQKLIAAGQYSLAAHYLGNFLSSDSGSQKLTVRKK